ncbi:MAG: hypothetical protein KatS3mg080_0463 [Anoxybacillus sp.]|nr:MAG: hypothetical protein KatS3mg080_0463 [Anoxybacillus sp.]
MQGYVDETGHLYVIDRLKDVIRLQTGEMFSPQFIENKLKFSPYIQEAVAIGRDRPYVVAIINIDMANVGRWAEKNQLVYYDIFRFVRETRSDSAYSRTSERN